MANQRKPFDVSPPGQKPVNHTSRPVIVGRSDRVKDPMVREQDKDSSEEKILSYRPELKLEPSEELLSQTKATSSTTESTTTQENSTAELAAPENIAVPDKPDLISSFDDDIRNPASAPQKETPAEDHIQQLVENKTYYLPIKRKASSKIIKVTLIALITVTVGAAAVYLIMTTLGTRGA